MMEKQKKWQLFLILAVIALTIYNTLPTVFYYCKPLNSSIRPSQAESIADAIVERVNGLEEQSQDWIRSFCTSLRINPKSIQCSEQNPEMVSVSFAKLEEANRFRAFLPRAGSLISDPVAQLSLAPLGADPKVVLVQRKIPIHLSSEMFSYAPAEDRQLLHSRMKQIAYALSGPSDASRYLNFIEQGNGPTPFIETLCSHINTLSDLFNGEGKIASRYAALFTQGNHAKPRAAIDALISSIDNLRDEIKKGKAALAEEKNGSSEEIESTLRLLEKKETAFLKAQNYLKAHASQFASGSSPLSLNEIDASLLISDRIDIGNRNPLFKELFIDLSSNRIVLKMHRDVAEFRRLGEKKNLFEQLIIDEVAKISRSTNETLKPSGDEISIPLNQLENLSGHLRLDLGKLAESYLSQLQESLRTYWHPKHPDLQHIQILTQAEYEKLSSEDRSVCIVLMSPLKDLNLRSDSLYLVAKGMNKIYQLYESYPNSELAALFSADFKELADSLRARGFVGYPGASEGPDSPIQAGDFVFEKGEFASLALKATREDFVVRGTKQFAYLELSDLQQRNLVQNKIETRIHEDLLKWKDEYHASQLSMDPHVRYDTPKPTQSTFWSNVALSLRKYFRGDERKIIRWGLDLSGGKTVQIELRDQDQKIVTDPDHIKQGMNELYSRVNKMGVSEVVIRQVGNTIALDFPGSQALSASDLIRASTMYFHVVNEKFSTSNAPLAESVNRFLLEVWNEAIVTNRKDPDSINEIAYKHLYGDEGKLRSEAASTLWEGGLRLSPPSESASSSKLDETLSKIAVLRGDSHSEWQGQSTPLLIVFKNFALEGSNLENIHSAYDPSKGNYLSFEVKSSFLGLSQKQVNPRGDLHAWTSRFSKEKIQGSPLESITRGRGWRMAVLLNHSIISSPTLDSALKDSAMISGSFSQREVNQLAADLKAGSLTYTPHILSEKNVSPELGKSDRIKGILATFVALLLVILSMVGYYRFAGLVASIAVLFNLLILWATLQNLGATLTLAGIAGIILTMGMAVDANVLVFERIKEEFALTGKIGSALNAGYQKAYSAIIDSNVTTIIAALILLNFDAGPIKNFAVNLVIGIVSSMFTALFMTRFYFSRWVKNPKNKELKMANWIQSSRLNFLKYAKLAFGVAAAIIVLGGSLVYHQRSSIFGMDFTGGYSLHIELKEDATGNYAQRAEKAILTGGVSKSDFQVRELNPPSHLRLLLGTTLEQKSKPFHGMSLEVDSKNPRIEWILHALETEGLSLTNDSLKSVESNWTAMSGQMSDAMRNNALLGLTLAFICIFIYLAFRFEYKFAAAAMICLLHDVFITLGLMGILFWLKVPLQIDLNTVAALMTIVGYSLNDTIIIFDRIREEMKFSHGKPLSQVVNLALNQTLSRTAITSGTTLLVLLALVALGGSSIFSFAFVMTIGVFFGTLSSWFIASPLMIFFHKREEEKETFVTAP
jgi:SecD/SecF fusion protein